MDEVRALESGGNERKPVGLQFREEGDESKVRLEKVLEALVSILVIISRAVGWY